MLLLAALIIGHFTSVEDWDCSNPAYAYMHAPACSQATPVWGGAKIHTHH